MRRISFTHIYIFGIIMTLSETKTQIARQLQTPGSSPPCGTDERRKVGKFSCPFVKTGHRNGTNRSRNSMISPHDLPQQESIPFCRMRERQKGIALPPTFKGDFS
jgi:hypothetical protein